MFALQDVPGFEKVQRQSPATCQEGPQFLKSFLQLESLENQLDFLWRFKPKLLVPGALTKQVVLPHLADIKFYVCYVSYVCYVNYLCKRLSLKVAGAAGC